MSEVNKYPGQLVFGLDIGTRSIVGTVGYKIGDKFYVVAQRVKEHETRAMLDGQIHDITAVANTIQEVKCQLEFAVGKPLKEVCIAAAGRVLRTITSHVDLEYPSEKEMTEEDILGLDSLGVEKAYEEFQASNKDTDMKFYCVGYTIIRYYLNGYQITNLQGHKAKKVGADLITTFLPDDVVDGLYKAVEMAGLEVANLTLEPIAAIRVAIPERFRMLNIGLIDVGAGTSDISITKDGSIVAYGMIPTAGDSITETLAHHCLVDFNTAEKIKRDMGVMDEVAFEDIFGLPQTYKSEELFNVIAPAIEKMAKQAAEKICELNGDRPVSAVFVVGGGGKIDGYTEGIARELGIQVERVALRGEEVMQKIEFLENDVKKDSLLVTPIGICLSFYEQNNNFIYVSFNDDRIKLYDNNHLTVVDVAMQADFQNENLFPRRGRELTFTVNGKSRIVRGQLGEAAVIAVNGEEADLHTAIKANDIVRIESSTAGEDAKMTIGKLPEFVGEIDVYVNEQIVSLPKFANVNGALQSEYYSICDGDEIEFLDYYTVKQIIEFMDVLLDENMHIYVNNKVADMDTKVYGNFSVMWSMAKLESDDDDDMTQSYDEMEDDDTKEIVESTPGMPQAVAQPSVTSTQSVTTTDTTVNPYAKEEQKTVTEAVNVQPAKPLEQQIGVIVNGRTYILKGKPEYVFVDVFDYIDFDLSRPQGSGIVTTINKQPAQYMETLKHGDVIEIYWKK